MVWRTSSCNVTWQQCKEMESDIRKKQCRQCFKQTVTAAIWVLFSGQVWTCRDVISWNLISRIRSYESHRNNKCNRRRWHRTAEHDRPQLWEECILQHLQHLTFTMKMSHRQMTTACELFMVRSWSHLHCFKPPGDDRHLWRRYLYSHKETVTLTSRGHNGNSKKWARLMFK